jgi:hypothetical protein
MRVELCISVAHHAQIVCAHNTRKPVLLYDPLPGEAEPLAVEAVSREVECGRQQRECEVYVCARACVRQGVRGAAQQQNFLGVIFCSLLNSDSFCKQICQTHFQRAFLVFFFERIFESLALCVLFAHHLLWQLPRDRTPSGCNCLFTISNEGHQERR